MTDMWVCNECKYHTSNEKKARKHSMKIVTAKYHELRLEER